MKKNILLLFLLLAGTIQAALAQQDEQPFNGTPSNVTVFAKEGDKFWLILNGEKQNDKPAANVKVTGLTAEYYKVKVIFEDPKLPSVDANLSTRDVDNKPTSTVYEVRKKAGKSTAMVIRVSSFETIKTQAVATNATRSPKPTAPVNATEGKTSGAVTSNNSEVKGMPQVSMTVKVPGMEGGAGAISVLGSDVEQQAGVTTGKGSVTSSVSTTTTKVNDNGVVKETYSTNTTPPLTHAPSRPAPKPVPATTTKPAGCKVPMSATAFNTQLSAIKKQSFSDTKKKTAKTAISKNCLSTEQVKTILNDFKFEADKLELAKFAYPFTVDKDNYISVTELFSFSSSTEELTDFLDGQ